MAGGTYYSTQSWVVPSDCQTIASFDCTGGGAAGQAGQSFTYDYNNGNSYGGASGYGGGAGARAIKYNIPVTPGETLTVYVGGAGGGYSGLYSSSRGWLCLAYGASGQTGGSPSVYDSGWTGASGAGGAYGSSGGNGANSPAYTGGGAGAQETYSATQSPGGNAYNYGCGGGGGAGGSIQYTFDTGSGGAAGSAGGAGYQGIASLSYTPSYPARVSGLSKTTGQISGGDVVVIIGSNFNYSVSHVRFGTADALSFTVNSATQITATSPPHAAGTVDVTVTNEYTTSPAVSADHFSFVYTNWTDNALFGLSAGLHVAGGLNLPIRASFAPSAGMQASLSDRQIFLLAQFSPTISISEVIKQPKGIFADLTIEQTFGGRTANTQYLSATFVAEVLAGIKGSLAQNIKAKAVVSVDYYRSVLGQVSIVPFAAILNASTGTVAKPNFPEAMELTFTPNAILHVHEFPAQFIYAESAVQTTFGADAELVLFAYDNNGSQVLYAEASGLEKAMVDADQPRITGIPAEIIVDTWDPYKCPAELLPYLAWAMGVNFWNANWSEETKRSWIASQWQFKALRGTDAAIKMAVDFAGRDVSPYGYSVRQIITQPQGQYPSPGITQAAQEEWLASLPQVRTYLFAQYGQAYSEEFFIDVSYLGTQSWVGQTYITPDTSKERLGKKAVWNVHGQDVSDVMVTDFGNYFQLHMPGQAYDEEAYCDSCWSNYSFPTPSDAWKRLVTIAPLTVSPYRIAVGPSLLAIEATPKLVAVPGVAGYDMFVGSNLYPDDGHGVYMAPSNVHQALSPIQNFPIFPSFILPNTADFRLFYRYPVYDPDDLPTGGTQGTMFMGVGWLDFPPFTAEIDVFMANTRCSAEFSVNDFLLPEGLFFIPQDNEPTAYVAGAIEAARKMTDLTLLQPKPTPVFSAGKPFLAGRDHFIVGQPQLSA